MSGLLCCLGRDTSRTVCFFRLESLYFPTMVEKCSDEWRARVDPEVVADCERQEVVVVPYVAGQTLNRALNVVRETRGLIPDSEKKPNRFFKIDDCGDQSVVTAIAEVHMDIVSLLDSGTMNLDLAEENQRSADVDYLRGIKI